MRALYLIYLPVKQLNAPVHIRFANVQITITIFDFIAVTVHMPKDRITLAHQGYGFVEFLGEEDADYAIKIMNMIKLYGKPIRVNKVSVCVCVCLSNYHC